MKKVILLSAASLIASMTLANEDLNLGGKERWEAKHTGYICDAFKAPTDAPLLHQDMNVQFELNTANVQKTETSSEEAAKAPKKNAKSHGMLSRYHTQ